MKGMPNKCTAWHGGWEKDTPSSLKIVMEKLEKNLPSSYFETGYVSGDFLCWSSPLPMALLTLPLLGEPAMAPNPTY